ncbi:SURF1 family protein [Demequina sediminicola]|uniref:SURF1 family protein n=1 Tax=Demequina sediminicola TaxID=1095026 RepID=UPI0007842EEE|nr:SURF1 family cytochrome oxidase biogenesis protein [Demequina sediminicola]
MSNSDTVSTGSGGQDGGGSSARKPGDIKWGTIAGVSVLGIIVITVCVALGLWQWTRGFTTGEVVATGDPVPIADEFEPATGAGGAVGKSVTAEGRWADEDAALVAGRTVEGADAVVVVRPYTVSADATGTGGEATLAVVVGWLPPEEVHDLPAPDPASDITGYVRGSEGVSGIGELPDSEVAGAFWAPTLSPAVFAQHWESPLYSAPLIAETPEEGLNAMPEPEPDRDVNFRSITYALEWWLFGAFFAFIAVRWIRDNGRVQPAPDDADAGAVDPALKEGSS